MTKNEPLLKLDLPGIPKIKSGKVREVFDLGDSFLFVTSDRISAFDVSSPNHGWFDVSALENSRRIRSRASFFQCLLYTRDPGD